jgi:hypothetical protein
MRINFSDRFATIGSLIGAIVPHPATSRLSKPKLALVAALVLVPACIKLLVYPHYLGSDDAYIYQQVARNIYLHGFWGVNPGVRCSLSTSPLFTIIEVIAHLIFRTHDVPAMQVLSCLTTAAGLLAIFLRVFKTTAGNWTAAVLGLGAAAFATNLWRWNGTLMETSFAFGAVALTLLCFTDMHFTPRRALFTGVLLGFNVLLRPELFLFGGTCIVLTLWLAPAAGKMKVLAAMVAGMLAPLVAWAIFAQNYFGAILPTTYRAKTIHGLILWNPIILKQYGQLMVLSLFWPTLLLVAVIFALRGVFAPKNARSLPVHLALPVLSLIPFAAFYYLRLQELESPGRYLLPYFPLACVALAELFAFAAALKPKKRWGRVAIAVLALHAVTSLYLNARYIAPALNAFHGQYFTAMQDATEYLAAHTQPGDRVLVELDIGVVAWIDDGRFVIADGGGLASPELAHKSPEEAIAIVRPRYLLQSRGNAVGDWQVLQVPLELRWHEGYDDAGVSTSQELYANIYAVPQK